MDPYGLSGKHLGPFEVLEHVGQGGMAVVYRGLQPSVGNREVALKIARPELGPEFLKRFSLEAANAGSLHHDNIVPIYAAGEALGYHYIAMRFVRGPRLEDVLEANFHRPLDSRYALEVLSQVARAIDYSHSCGIVHRDINPRNIMLEKGSESRVYVTDFGIAIAVQDATTRLTMPGTHVGTLQYMAPEQYDSKRFGTVGPWSDIWALAVLAYQVLTGWRPFETEGDSIVGLALQIARKSPKPPRMLNPRLPPMVDEVICGQGLARDPGQRPSSCAGFVAALEKALMTRPPARAVRYARPIAIALGSALALIALVMLLTWGVNRTRGGSHVTATSRGEGGTGSASQTVTARGTPHPASRSPRPEKAASAEQGPQTSTLRAQAASAPGHSASHEALDQGQSEQPAAREKETARSVRVQHYRPRRPKRSRPKPVVARQPSVPREKPATKPAAHASEGRRKPSTIDVTNVDQ